MRLKFFKFFLDLLNDTCCNFSSDFCRGYMFVKCFLALSKFVFDFFCDFMSYFSFCLCLEIPPSINKNGKHRCSYSSVKFE